MKLRPLIALLLSGSYLFIAGCNIEDTSKKDEDSTVKYNQLVKKYNDIVNKYNSQTKRNVEGDNDVKKASLDLMRLDGAVSIYKEAVESAYRNIDAKQCKKAETTINKDVKSRLESIASKANSLSQGTLAKALDRMANDLSSYKEGTKELAKTNILATKAELGEGLAGIKSFAISTHNQLVDEYSEKCVDIRREISPAGESRADRDHGISKDDVVTVDGSGKRKVMSRGDLESKYRGTYDVNAYNHFTDIAIGSGGFVGFSPTPELFSETVDVVLESIMVKAGSQTDVAIVLDTTSSMSDDINDVKKNMKRLLEKLKVKASSIGLRLSLVLYRDKGDTYIVNVARDFTSDIDVIDVDIQKVKVNGGGDTPEAVIDALDAAMKSLSWRSSASRSVVLIGDAPGHDSSHSGVSTAQLVQNYKKAGLGIIVYPILVSR